MPLICDLKEAAPARGSQVPRQEREALGGAGRAALPRRAALCAHGRKGRCDCCYAIQDPLARKENDPNGSDYLLFFLYLFVVFF